MCENDVETFFIYESRKQIKTHFDSFKAKSRRAFFANLKSKTCVKRATQQSRDAHSLRTLKTKYLEIASRSVCHGRKLCWNICIYESTKQIKAHFDVFKAKSRRAFFASLKSKTFVKRVAQQSRGAYSLWALKAKHLEIASRSACHVRKLCWSFFYRRTNQANPSTFWCFQSKATTRILCRPEKQNICKARRAASAMCANDA